MTISFSKMQVCGNDFMVVDGFNQDLEIGTQEARSWSNRRTGIGFDQLLLINPPPHDSSLDISLEIINSDGSIAEQCGNGCAAVVALLHTREFQQKHNFRLGTLGGVVSCAIQGRLPLATVTVELNPPNFDSASVPFLSDAHGPSHLIECKALNRTVETTVLSMGNPHAVILVDDVNSIDLESLGTELQNHSMFPESVNVEILDCVDKSKAQLRIYERGVGETHACGSGACAAMVAGRLAGRLSAQVSIQMPGGSVDASWKDQDDPIHLVCQPKLAYQGSIYT